MSRRIQLALLVVGAALFSLIVVRIGPARVLDNAEAVGWLFIPILLLYGVAYAANTAAWRLTMGDGHRPGFPEQLLTLSKTTGDGAPTQKRYMALVCSARAAMDRIMPNNDELVRYFAGDDEIPGDAIVDTDELIHRQENENAPPAMPPESLEDFEKAIRGENVPRVPANPPANPDCASCVRTRPNDAVARRQ